MVRDLRDLKAFGDLLHPPQRGQRFFDRHRIEPAGLAEAVAQPGRFLLLVQNAIIAAPQRLGNDQPHAVGPDVDGGQPARDLGRQKELLFSFFH